MHTLSVALPVAVIGAWLTMLALVSPVRGVAPLPEPVCRFSEAHSHRQPGAWSQVGLGSADRTSF